MKHRLGTLFLLAAALSLPVPAFTLDGPNQDSEARRGGRYGQPREWSKGSVPAAPAESQELLGLGQRLYGWNCFPCHGVEGRGDGPVAVRRGLFPPDFTRGYFKLKTSGLGEMPFDEDLFRTISSGIASAGMLGIDGLEPHDRWALVGYLKTLVVGRTPEGRQEPHFKTKPPTLRWSAPALPLERDLDPARGRELFVNRVRCAACHGPGGKGDGPAALLLLDAAERPARIPDLTRGELALKSGAGLQDLYRVLSLGMAGTSMPSFASLPEKDRWDLAAYVRSLFEPVAPGEKVFLLAGCVACHTMGGGKKIGPDLGDVAARRDRAWLERWLADPPGMLLRNPAARKEFKDYSVEMPNLNLTRAEIDDVIDYLRNSLPASRRK